MNIAAVSSDATNHTSRARVMILAYPGNVDSLTARPQPLGHQGQYGGFPCAVDAFKSD